MFPKQSYVSASFYLTYFLKPKYVYDACSTLIHFIFFLQVHATDEDKGVNGQVKYSIVQQPNQKGTKFVVDEETGEVSTNKVYNSNMLICAYLFNVLHSCLCVESRNQDITSLNGVRVKT